MCAVLSCVGKNPHEAMNKLTAQGPFFMVRYIAIGSFNSRDGLSNRGNRADLWSKGPVPNY